MIETPPLQDALAQRGHHDELSPRVGRARAPLDQVLRLEPVDRSRKAALRQPGPLGELGRPDADGRALIERGEDVVLGEEEAARRFRVTIHRARNSQAGAHERQPRLQLAPGEFPPGAGAGNKLCSQRVDCIINYRRSWSAKERHTQMTWYIDPYHTQATFSVKHMMVSTVRGRLGKLRGEIDIDPENPHRASFEIGADVTAIDTGDARRDGHLRSADFFDVEKYPEIVFKSSAVFP